MWLCDTGGMHGMVLGASARRFMIFSAAAIVGSAVGSMLTWTDSSQWIHANPLTAGPGAAALGLGPAIFVAATAPMGRPATAAVAVAMALAMVALWAGFAFSDSSTAVFIFLWGWWVGVPAAFGLVAVTDPLHTERT